jgi:hypothetical protein
MKDQITKEQGRAVTKEILEAIQGVLDKHGLTLDSQKSNYGDIYGITIRATRASLNENGINTNSLEATAFLLNAQHHGVTDTVEALGKPFTYRGEEYRVIGYNTRARRRPFMIEKISEPGRVYNAPDTIAPYIPTYDASTDIYR